MPGSELHHFQAIIERDLTMLMAQHLPLTKHLIKAFAMLLSEETERVKVGISLAAITHRQQNKMHMYIQEYQQRIIILTSQLAAVVRPNILFRKNPRIDHAVVCQQLYTSLDDLLDFIEAHYSEYSDKGLWIPSRYRELIRYDIAANLNEFEEKLSDLQIAGELRALTLEPLLDLMNSATSMSFTYQRIVYTKTLRFELFRFMQVQHSEPDNELMNLLFRINYNSPRYLEYSMRIVRQQIDGLSFPEQLERLAHFQKIVRQRLVAGPGFDIHVDSVKDILSAWIQEEIDYVEIALKAGEARPELFATDSAAVRFQVNLSTEEILYILFIYVELGILERDYVTALAKGLSGVIRTKRQATFSWKSLRTKFYKAEHRTMMSVKALLERMIGYINDHVGLK